MCLVTVKHPLITKIGQHLVSPQNINPFLNRYGDIVREASNLERKNNNERVATCNS